MLAPTLQRLTTGVPGLDDVLHGGLPSGRVYLIEGSPGTGKTTLALQFLLAGVQAGERCLYITLSESKAELGAVADSHGWSLSGIDLFELVTDEGLDPEQEQSVLHPAELELGETVTAVIERVGQTNPVRLVFDSLSELRLLAQSPLRYRRQVLALKQFLSGRGCTVLLLDDRAAGLGDLRLHSIAHGVLTLEQLLLDFGAERRRMRVMKLRGSTYRGGWHDYTIRYGGLVSFPRLVSNEHGMEFDPARVSSGSAEFDEMLGGGLVPGTNVLLMGPSGAGKTSAATATAMAALRRGERVAYFLFDENVSTLLVRSTALGMDLRPYVTSGHLLLQQIDPAELSPGEFATNVVNSVEQDGARVVVIDSLNAYMQSMPGEQFLLLQMHELLAFLNHRGALTVLILAQHGLIGHVRSSVDLSYLADAVVLMRFFEVDGVVRKAISVLKTRTAQHQPTVREFRLGSSGLIVGAPLKGFRGVLTGVPDWDGTPSDLMPL